MSEASRGVCVTITGTAVFITYNAFHPYSETGAQIPEPLWSWPPTPSLRYDGQACFGPTPVYVARLFGSANKFNDLAPSSKSHKIKSFVCLQYKDSWVLCQSPLYEQLHFKPSAASLNTRGATYGAKYMYINAFYFCECYILQM